MSRRLDDILARFMRETSSQSQCTMWYSTKNGIIYGIGDQKPLFIQEREYVMPLRLVCDEHGPCPQLADQNLRFTKAIDYVLAQITLYRKHMLGNEEKVW